MEAGHAVSVVSAQPGEIQGEEDKKQRRWHFLAAASRMQFPWFLLNREKYKEKKIRSRDAGTFWRPPHEPI
ncbi:hypothetical protein QE152_g7339 [Popillia japonica]|uniref:Uncharacterized protein n=1 Tax=Popillia japonica TaxID=7064 RepID=A0AAW1MDP0_POPJA